MAQEREILVTVDGLGKKFSKSLKKSLIYGLIDVGKSVLGLGSKARSTLRHDEFWAVRNVSFELRRGEVLGLIGHNGAGKSTLLKMLNGLIRPDEGTITMRGRIGALIELGTGFNPILSGRENVYINGQILGFSKKEIDAKLESIIDFSEIRDFIDSPVQTYSSGMKVRLGFAVASQMEPDVLIIDEVLAVGDVGFRGKCMKVISEMMNKAAVIFVSHSMPIVNRYCNRGLLMSKGEVLVNCYDVQKAIDAYLDSFDQKENSKIFSSGQLELVEFECNSMDLLQCTAVIDLFSTATFRIRLKRLDPKIKEVRLRYNFIDRNLVLLASVVSEAVNIIDDEVEVRLKVGPFNVQPGEYKLSVVLFGSDMFDPIMIHDAAYTLDVRGAQKDYGGNSVLFHVENY